MDEEKNYTLLMLDLNSANVEIKLSALKEIGNIENKEKFKSMILKLKAHKDEKIREEALKISKDAGFEVKEVFLTRESEDDNIEQYIFNRYSAIISVKDYEVFKNYLFSRFDNPDKKAYLPADLKEVIQKYLNNQDSSIRAKAIFPVACLPFEYKYKVNVLVDLLRDKSPFVVAQTIKFLPDIENEIVKRTIPILVDKYNSSEPHVIEALDSYLLNLNRDAFLKEIQEIQNNGMDIKIQKNLVKKLNEFLI